MKDHGIVLPIVLLLLALSLIITATSIMSVRHSLAITNREQSSRRKQDQGHNLISNTSSIYDRLKCFGKERGLCTYSPVQAFQFNSNNPVLTCTTANSTIAKGMPLATACSQSDLPADFDSLTIVGDVNAIQFLLPARTNSRRLIIVGNLRLESLTLSSALELLVAGDVHIDSLIATSGVQLSIFTSRGNLTINSASPEIKLGGAVAKDIVLPAGLLFSKFIPDHLRLKEIMLGVVQHAQ